LIVLILVILAQGLGTCGAILKGVLVLGIGVIVLAWLWLSWHGSSGLGMGVLDLEVIFGICKFGNLGVGVTYYCRV
jgi:hypothetical protein